MDYSVGSLADLISGTNTPNKPKVIKKAFKKSKNVNGGIANTEENTISKNFKTKKVNKSKIIRTKEKANNDNIKPKKNFKTPKVIVNTEIKKRVKADLVEERKLPSSNDVSATENIKPKKPKKRTLEDDKTDSNENGESPPKKKKLNKNEENAERRVKKKIKEEERVQDPEEVARTIFVGNVPIKCDKKKIRKYFKKHGEIEAIRIRGIPVADLNTSKKVAAIKKEFNPNRSNVYCYIRFANKESALKAEIENGALFQEHHLRVHSCSKSEKPDESLAIFVGNLSFNAIEDDLWKTFEVCGPISYVRIIRDSHTGMGKGFGYVNFKDSDAVQLALEMENVKLNDRELRISLCNLNSAKKNKNNKRNNKITQPGKAKQQNKIKKQLNEQTTNGPQTKVKQVNKDFQGTKFGEKKKNKMNKGLSQKKKLIKKIAPKPK